MCLAFNVKQAETEILELSLRERTLTARRTALWINFCVNNTISYQMVRHYANDKPWITSDLKALFNKKKRALRAGDEGELRAAQKELKVKLREQRGLQLEAAFQTPAEWSMKQITVFKAHQIEWCGETKWRFSSPQPSPQLLSEKLQQMQEYSSTISWITDYLTARPQYVCQRQLINSPTSFPLNPVHLGHTVQLC